MKRSFARNSARIHINAVMNSLSRRDFLKMLSGAAGAITFGPALRLQLPARLQLDNAAQDVPPSLMLHTKDRWKLVNIMKWVSAQGYNGLTYRDYAKVLRGEEILPANPIIISLDDIGTSYIQPEFMQMIEIIQKAGYVGMLGVVTRETPSETPGIWKVINEINDQGWEIDTHTINHPVLPSLTNIDDMRMEIIDSSKMIEDGIGITPNSLIVPYANLHNRLGALDNRIFTVSAEAKLDFVVGMAQGRQVTPGQPPYYLGRVGVGIDSVQTAYWLTHFNKSVGPTSSSS